MITIYNIYILIGYLSGSILYAYWIPKLFYHIDVREKSDDKNPGVANAFVYAGVECGSICIVLELLKAFLPVYIASRHLDITDIRFALVIAAPVIGHAFPLFFKGKGGKSIAASFGVLLGICKIHWIVLVLVVFYLLFSLVIIIKPNYYRSMLTFALFAGNSIFLCHINSIRLGCLLISAIVITKHIMMSQKEQPEISFLHAK